MVNTSNYPNDLKNVLYSNEQKIRELEQEKILYKALSDYLIKKDDSYLTIFDNIDHILRTPLTVIKSYTEMLLDNQFGNISYVQKEKIEMIKKNTDVLLDVIFDLLKEKNNINGT